MAALSGNTQPTSWLAPLTKDARYWRACLSFISKASEEQVKQIPVIGPLLLGFAEAVKELPKMADAQPQAVVAACRKLLDGQRLDADDGQALAELVRRRDGDTAEQRFAREWMFEWLWRKHQPKART